MKQTNKQRAAAEQAADRKRFEEAIRREEELMRDTAACDRGEYLCAVCDPWSTTRSSD
jgi:hypothetical protein